MTAHEFESWIEAYVTGDLSPARRRRLQEHLSACPACREGVELLESIRKQARALPPALDPSGDLWPAISARLGEPPLAAAPTRPPAAAVESTEDSAGGRHGRVWARSRPALAAAALALIALGLSAWWIARGPSPLIHATSEPAGQGQGIGATAAGSLLSEFAATETAYLAAAAALESALAAERVNLEPATAAVIDRNLRILDNALGELRAAALASPRDAGALEFLADGYRRKVDVLMRLARISAGVSAEIRAEAAS